MKKRFLILILLQFISCKTTVENNFDEIVHFSITDEMAQKNESNQKFKHLYSSLESVQKIDPDFEKDLLNYGFIKKIATKEVVAKINHSISNDLNLEYHQSACEPMYRDILILKKNNITKAILKICFECEMNDAIGKIKSNFDCESDKISNYAILKKLLKK
jgi:hypothetical protein